MEWAEKDALEMMDLCRQASVQLEVGNIDGALRLDAQDPSTLAGLGDCYLQQDAMAEARRPGGRVFLVYGFSPCGPKTRPGRRSSMPPPGVCSSTVW